MMTYFIETDSDGWVAQCHEIATDDEPPSGARFTEVQSPPNWAAPSPTSRLRMVDGSPVWVEAADIQQVRESVWSRIKGSRTGAELSDFTFQGKLYQANKEQITGYVTAALISIQFAQPFSQKWTLKDNTVETFDAQRMIGLGVALMQHVASAYDKGRTIRALIDAPSATIEQLNAITWDQP